MPENPSTGLRIKSLDTARGFLLFVIAFTHAASMVKGTQAPELWYEIIGLNDVFTFDIVRFIGHPVATSFALSMGMSLALLHHNKKKSGWAEKDIISFVLKRAIFLLVLQFSIINTIWALADKSINWSDLSFLSILSLYKDYYNYFGVLFMLGSCLFITAFFLRAPLIFLIIAGLVIVISPYFYLSLISAAIDAHWWLGPLAIPGGWPGIWVLYPIIPWLGITFIGVAMGQFFLKKTDLFLKYRGRAALICVFVFLIYITFRFIEDINDPLKALDIARYPPDFFLLFFGIGLLIYLMILFEKIQNYYFINIFNLFGQSRVFFYVFHLFFSMFFSGLVEYCNFYISVILVFSFNISTMIILCLIYKNAYMILKNIVFLNLKKTM